MNNEYDVQVPEKLVQTQKTKVNPNTWIILGCIIVLVLTMSTVMFYMIKHVEELTANPFVYGAIKSTEIYGSELSYTCYVSGLRDNSESKFYFNSTLLWNDPPVPKDYEGLTLNISDLQRFAK